jgi:prolyl-tRNA editing enzyme YbaK/EbsC (Cys-tRNA(Pro) deacylase)
MYEIPTKYPFWKTRPLTSNYYGKRGLALVKALKTLGYSHAYHANDAIFVNPQDCELWLEALRAKFDGKGKPWGRKEFDQLLGHCQVGASAFVHGSI